MDRLFPLAHRSFRLVSFLGMFRENRKISADAARLDSLPAERLRDMGLSPRTEANRRHSGQQGKIPSASLW